MRLNDKAADFINSRKHLPVAIGGRALDDLTTWVGVKMHGIEAETCDRLREFMENFGPEAGIYLDEFSRHGVTLTTLYALNKIGEKYLGNTRLGNIPLIPLITIPSYFAAINNSYECLP